MLHIKVETQQFAQPFFMVQGYHSLNQQKFETALICANNEFAVHKIMAPLLYSLHPCNKFSFIDKFKAC